MSGDDSTHHGRNRRPVFTKLYDRAHNYPRIVRWGKRKEPAMVRTVRVLGSTGFPRNTEVANPGSHGGPAINHHRERLPQERNFIGPGDYREVLFITIRRYQSRDRRPAIVPGQHRVKTHHADKCLRVFALADGHIERNRIRPPV